ncbi:MAG TPA: Bax inhibitor-1/YccA family protein [Longimicrobium sp.]|nr:Bax inhibitor-1/YccA family protein [Longimicrobium sp.]
MRTSNPALNGKTFEGHLRTGEAMTVEGTVNKTGFLLFTLMIPATWMWGQVYGAWSAAPPMGMMMLGLVGGLVFALVTIFKKEWAPFTAPLYAACEGLLLGGISAIAATQYGAGIVIQAVALTFGTLLCLLAAYRSGLIRATENFRLGVVAATGGIAMLYLVNIVMRMFGGGGIGFIHEAGTFGILFSLFVVVIAALNLVLDFDFIEQGAEMGAPKYMEWYAAFSLMLTLVWLYLEILRLLMKLNSRD